MMIRTIFSIMLFAASIVAFGFFYWQILAIFIVICIAALIYSKTIKAPAMSRNKEVIVFAIFVAIFIVLFSFSSCKKEKQKTYNVTITCYAEHPKFLFVYKDKDAWHSDTIRTSNYVKTFECNEEDLKCAQQMKSLLTYSTDSMHIRGEYDSKKIEEGFRSNSGLFNVSVQLSQAR